MKKQHIIIASVLVASLLLIGGVSAKTSFSWERVEILVANLLAGRVDSPVTESADEYGNDIIGVAGDTYGTQPMSMIIFATSTGNNTPSTTMGAMLNNSGRTRAIRKLEQVSRGTASTAQTYQTVRMEFGTSTDRYTTSTAPIYTTLFVTSTDPTPVYITTSTFDGQGWKTIWKNGEYLQCGTNKSVSSTDGYCMAEWVYIQ